LGKAGKELETVERKAIRGKKIETIAEKEEIKEENSGVKEWTKENNNEMSNITDPYYKL